MTKEHVIYLGPFHFPDGGAAARRILGVSQTLQLLGKKVTVASGQMQNEKGSKFNYKDIDVHSLNERTGENYPKYIKYLMYFSMGKKTIAWLDALPKKPQAIILYSGYSPYFLRLLPWCKKNNIPLIFDAVEWYDPPSLFKGLLNPYYWNIEFAMRFLSKKSKNIIAISHYLTNYYESKGCNVVRIPPTLDVFSVEPRLLVKDPSTIVLGYTGSPGHKDLLDNVLSAILVINDQGNRIKFNIAGISEEQLLNYPALKNKNYRTLPSCFECFGVVSQAEALDIIKNADFSVLLRPNKRYAKAGFPTKFVESLTVGTPVIANHTSDLTDYLIDGENGIVCKDEQPASLVQGINAALNLNLKQLQSLRLSARRTAEECFDVRVAKEQLKSKLDMAR